MIYQLYNWTEDSLADNLFKKVLESEEEQLTGAAKEVKLGEILSLHQKNKTLPAFLSELMSGIVDSIEVTFYEISLIW